jgi:hypothetical protein
MVTPYEVKEDNGKFTVQREGFTFDRCESREDAEHVSAQLSKTDQITEFVEASRRSLIAMVKDRCDLSHEEAREEVAAAIAVGDWLDETSIQ